jgi:hypothetical protein
MRVRRIVVRLDPAPRSRAVLDAAAALAASLNAKPVGLFVESASLLNFAAFPFAHEIGFHSAMRRPLDVASMERVLRLRLKEARELIALAGRHSPVPWSFHVASAAKQADAFAMVTQSDLVVAHLAHLDELARSPSVRVVRAGQIDELRGALAAESEGVIVLAGSDEVVAETLRRLHEEQRQ